MIEEWWKYRHLHLENNLFKSPLVERLLTIKRETTRIKVRVKNISEITVPFANSQEAEKSKVNLIKRWKVGEQSEDIISTADFWTQLQSYFNLCFVLHLLEDAGSSDMRDYCLCKKEKVLSVPIM